jgi:adenylate kinase
VISLIPEFDYIVGSAVLRQLAGEKFTNFDSLPPSEKHAYRVAAIEWMNERQRCERRHILCDGHTALLNENTGTVEPVFTEDDCRFFRELILVEAPADVILSRRQNDLVKRRSIDPKTIADEIAAEHSTSRTLAEAWGMVLHKLPPNIGPQTCTRLLELLRS